MSIYSSPDPNNYTLGKGVVSIAAWSGATIGSYVDVGNCTSFSVEPTEESIEHYESRTAAAALDEEAITKTGYTLQFELDEMAVNNLKMFLKGTATGPVIYANREMSARYAVRVVEDNSKVPNKKWDFWKVKLTPNGALNLIGDDWMKLSFTGKGLADTAGHTTSPFFTAVYVTTTTTTTTAA